IKTVIGQDDALMPALKSGELDLMISFGGRTEDDLTSSPVVEDVMGVAARDSHQIFRRKHRLKIKELLEFRWVLAAPPVDSRRWLDSAFDAQGLSRPVAQIETNLVLLLPRLIVQTGLLTFISRRHLGTSGIGANLREVRVKETTMRRALKLLHRKDCYLSPAARRLVALIRKSGRAWLEEP